jgi:serine/threonine protein kinase
MAASITICNTENQSGSFACFNCDVNVFTGVSHLCKIKKQSDNTIIDFAEFLNTLRDDNICFKVLTNKSKFETEYANIVILKGIFTDNFSQYTTFYEYDGCVGFEISMTEGGMFNIDKLYQSSYQTNVIYVLLQHKCVDIATYDKYDIGGLVSDITPVLTTLHSNQYVHNDIKYNNVVYCGDKFKLIDYGEMKHVSEFKYSTPNNVFSNEIAELNKIPTQIGHIKEYNSRQQLKSSQSSRPGGSIRRRALMNRTTRKRRYNKKYRTSKKTLKYRNRKPTHCKK